MLKKKKTTASGKLVLVKSVRRTRSHRMKFCVQRGLGNPQQAAPGAEWLSWGIACRFLGDTKTASERNFPVSLTGLSFFKFLRNFL